MKDRQAKRCFPLLLILGLLAAGSQVHAYGEPANGFPSWEERMVHVMTNRARSDPAADLAECTVCAEKDCYGQVPPLVYSYNLNRAARFHCANLASCGCGLQHDSPCDLVDGIGDLYTPGPCDGSKECACQGGECDCSGTDWSARISAFGTSPSAENAAGGGGDPVSVFYMWLWEPDSNPECDWRMSNGHRANILGERSGQLGVGYEGYYVQDFAGGTPDRKIPAGAHYPNAPSDEVEFRANWYDPAGGPTQALVNIDGTCHAMTLERGTTDNGTYLFTGPAAGACPRYYFLFKDSAGGQVTYPDTGSFGIGCEDWEETRPAAGDGCDCTPSCGTNVCGDDGCGGSCGDCDPGFACSAGACVPASADPLPDGSEPPPTDASSDAPADPAADAGDEGDDGGGDGGCGCAVAR